VITLRCATGAGPNAFGAGGRCAKGVALSLTRSCTRAGGAGTGGDGGANRTCSPSARSRRASQKKVKPGIPNDCPPSEMLNNNACASKDNNNAVVDRQYGRCAVEAVIKCMPCAGPVNAVTDFTLDNSSDRIAAGRASIASCRTAKRPDCHDRPLSANGRRCECFSVRCCCSHSNPQGEG